MIDLLKAEEEFKKYGNYFEIRDDIISFSLKTKDILQNKDVFLHLLDLTEYGILRYLDDFKNINYGLPFLKIYESYKMRDMGKLSNYTKIESSSFLQNPLYIFLLLSFLSFSSLIVFLQDRSLLL